MSIDLEQTSNPDVLGGGYTPENTDLMPPTDLGADKSVEPDVSQAKESLTPDPLKKITLIRKTVSTLKNSTSQHKKTISVEVRKKRTFIRRDSADLPVTETENHPESSNEGREDILSEYQAIDTQLVDTTIGDSQDGVAQPEFVAKTNDNITSELLAQPQDHLKAPDRLIRMPELIWLTGISRSSIYLKMNPLKQKFYDSTFPKGEKKGERTRAWKLSEVMAWINKAGV